MKCENCAHWVTSRVTEYGDGSVIRNWDAPHGKGDCDSLRMETACDFGCNYFEGAPSHIVTITKDGAPWQNFVIGNCPECGGRGSHQVEFRAACRRCAGLGKVRHYDDGYVADATWDHPKEKELKRRIGQEPAIDPGTVLAPLQSKKSGLMDVA